MNCNEVQGYFLSRPQPVEALSEELANTLRQSSSLI